MASCGYLWYTKILCMHTNICFSSFSLTHIWSRFILVSVVFVFLPQHLFFLKNSNKQFSLALIFWPMHIWYNNWNNQWSLSLSFSFHPQRLGPIFLSCFSVNVKHACTHTYFVSKSIQVCIMTDLQDSWVSTTTAMDICGGGTVAMTTSFCIWWWQGLSLPVYGVSLSIITRLWCIHLSIHVTCTGLCVLLMCVCVCVQGKMVRRSPKSADGNMESLWYLSAGKPPLPPEEAFWKLLFIYLFKYMSLFFSFFF